MKIVILDTPVSKDNLVMDRLFALGEVTIYKTTSYAETLGRLQDADIALTNKVVLDSSIISQLPKLKYIGVLATGYNMVDLEAATQQHIVVSNIPAYSTDSVAQMVWAHILNITNRVDYYAQQNRNGRWSSSNYFCYYDFNHQELCNKTIGIVGLGNTGKAVARIAQAFGMHVMAFTSKETLPDGIEKVTLDKLFSESDIVSLHCPLNKDTHHLVNHQRIGQMKSDAILINTSRGPVIDEDEVAKALNEGRIAAFGCDVLTTEPPASGTPLLTAKNAYITPHIAWATEQARIRLMEICADNVQAFINGSPQNQVNA